jgi:ATP-dependent Clp protease ATP-binding subunit ClpC
MFERFTDRARRVVVLAQEEARMLKHNYIGTEHILLGLIHEGGGVAALALEHIGISQDAARQRVEEIIGHGTKPPAGHIPFTPRAKKVLELALREALQLGHKYIGTEHLLLGLLREEEGVAAQVLTQLGASLDDVREAVIELLSGYSEPAPEAAGGGSIGIMTELLTEVVEEGAEQEDPRCLRCTARLAETLAVTTLETTVGEGTIELKIAHCGRCGTSLGVVP